MTASTTTSNNSRRIEAPVEGASSRVAGTATVRLGGEELSADPFELFAAGVTNLEPAAVGSALHPHRQPEGLLHVRCQSPKLRALTPRRAPGPVGANPVLRLPDRQPEREHNLQAMLLAGHRVERDQRTRMACCDRASAHRGLDRGARTEEPYRLRHRNTV